MFDLIFEYKNFIYGLLIFIIMALSAYLGFLLMLVKHKKKIDQAEQFKKEKELNDRIEHFKESIKIISKATLQKQCEPSEACIRIEKLLDLFPDLKKSEELKPLIDFQKKLSVFDYLEARNNLPKQEKFNQDKERFEVEKEYADSFPKCLEFLLSKLS